MILSQVSSSKEKKDPNEPWGEYGMIVKVKVSGIDLRVVIFQHQVTWRAISGFSLEETSFFPTKLVRLFLFCPMAQIYRNFWRIGEKMRSDLQYIYDRCLESMYDLRIF